MSEWRQTRGWGWWPGISGTVGATTLSVEQLASHHHPVPANSIDYITAGTGQAYYVLLPGSGVKTSPTGGSQSHTHSLSGVKSGSANSLPPYYAGHYVIRV